jgi:hypothetical protein
MGAPRVTGNVARAGNAPGRLHPGNVTEKGNPVKPRTCGGACGRSGLFQSDSDPIGAAPPNGSSNVEPMRHLSALRSVSAFIAVAALLLPDPAVGQVVQSPYSFIDSRHEGGLLVGALSENRGQLGLGPGGGPVFGGFYGIKLGGAFAFEAHAFILDTDRRVIDPEAEDAPETLGTTSSVVGAVDARIRLSPMGPRTWRDLAPYAVAGGGIALDFRRSSLLEEEMSEQARFSFGPSFLGTLGGGVRWLPGDRLGLRLEGTFHLWTLGTPSPFLLLGDELGSVPDQEWTGFGTVRLGASLRF